MGTTDVVNLLATSHDYLHAAQAATDDLFLLAGIYEIKKNVLNYYRPDLNRPLYSVRAILGLLRRMVAYEAWGDVEKDPFVSLLALENLWKAELSEE